MGRFGTRRSAKKTTAPNIGIGVFEAPGMLLGRVARHAEFAPDLMGALAAFHDGDAAVRGRRMRSARHARQGGRS